MFNVFDFNAWRAWILAILGAVFGFTCSGCEGGFGNQGMKAVNSTKAVEAISAAEHSTPMAVPGYLTGVPNLADKIILINAPGGKDIKATFRYPDGTVAAEVDSSRSASVNALLASIAGIDAGKFAEDARRDQLVADLIDKLLSYVPGPQATSALLTQALERKVNPPATTEPSRIDRIEHQVDTMTNLLLKLDEKLKGGGGAGGGTGGTP